MQNSRGPEGAEPALARAHAQAHIPTDIIEGFGFAISDGMLDIGASGKFAFADQLAIGMVALDLGEAVAEGVRCAVCGVRDAVCSRRSVVNIRKAFQMSAA